MFHRRMISILSLLLPLWRMNLWHALKPQFNRCSLHNFICGLGIISTISKSIRIYCDNAATELFFKNDRYSKGVEHMDLNYLSIKEKVQNQIIQIVHIGTNGMLADPLAKELAPKTFIGHNESICEVLI